MYELEKYEEGKYIVRKKGIFIMNVFKENKKWKTSVSGGVLYESRKQAIESNIS